MSLPATRKPGSKGGARRFGSGDNVDERSASQVWPRVNAFLALRSASTQLTYAAIVKEWCEFLGAEAGSDEAAKLLLGARDFHAAAYRKWLEGRPGQSPRFQRSTGSRERLPSAGRRSERRDGLQHSLANATISKKLAALRRIYRMLLAADLGLRANPFDTDSVPPPPARSGQKRPTEMVDFKLVKRIVTVPDAREPKGVRDRALLALLFGGGLRRGEAAVLRVGDLRRTAKGTLFVRLRATKGKTDADHALPAWSGAYLDALLAQRRSEGAAAGDYLFVSYRGRGGKTATSEPVSTSGIYKLFKSCCAAAGAGDFVTPHSARATAITKLLEDGLSHRHVQEFSRHASVQMVEVYDKRRIGVDEAPGRDLDFEE